MSAKSVIEAASGAYRCIFGEEMPETLMEGISADSRCTYCHEYYTGDAREMCHAAKEGDLEAIMRMAREMSRYVSPGDTLVPIPSHTGRATMTLELAKQIAWNSGARVEDVLIGSSRKSLYELKREGVQVPEGFFGLRLVRPVEGRIWLVDNVVATGSTAREALKLLPGARVLSYAMDSGRYIPMTEAVDTGRVNDFLASEAVKLCPFDSSLLADNCIANLHDVCDKTTGMYHYTLKQPVRFIHYTDDDSRLSEIIRSGAIRCMPCRGDSTHGVWTNIFGEKLLSDFTYKSAIVFDAPAGTPIELMNNTQALFHADIPQEWFVSVNFMVGPDMSANMLGFIGEHGERWPDNRIVELFTGEDSGRLASFVSPENMEKMLKLYTGRDISLGATHPITESYTGDIAAVARRIKGGEEPNFTHHGYLLNKWLVHYSPDAETVAEEGFRYARFPWDDMAKSLETDPESPDYLNNVGIDGSIVFAFPLADELDDPHYIAYDGSDICPGRGAAVFIGSGEYVNSAFEREDQVIVDKATVHGALYVTPRGEVYGSRRMLNPGSISGGYAGAFRWIADNQEKALAGMFRWDGTDPVPSINPI